MSDFIDLSVPIGLNNFLFYFLFIFDAGDGLINKQQFHQLLNRFAKVKDREEEMERDLRAAFQGWQLLFCHVLSSFARFNLTYMYESFVYQVFDRDGNGYISRDELRSAMEMLGEPLGEAHLDQLMRETDLDSDGHIDYKEFCIKFRQLF